MQDHRKVFLFILIAIVITIFSSPSFAGTRPVGIKAMMILASNESSAQDLRLDAVEYKLRRIFGFEYYKHFGEASAMVNIPGNTTLDLGHGYRLKIRVSGADNGFKASVNWLRGDESVLNTTVKMKRRVPVILGGISHGGGTLIVTLTAE